MKKIINIFLFFILLFSLFTTEASSINALDFKYDTLPLENNNLTHYVMTKGPISSYVVDITFGEDTSEQVDKISRFFNSNLLRFIIPSKLISVENLDFTINFKKDINFIVNPFFYTSWIYDYQDGNVSNSTYITNNIHTLSVKGFDGYFFYFRGKPLRLRLSSFVFLGKYDNITIIA